MNQKDRCSCFYKAGIAGYFAPRAVFPSLVGRPRMLSILAGTDLKYSCSGMCKAGFSVVSAPRAVLPEVYRKIGLIWDGVFSSTAPCIWLSLVRAVCLRSTGLLIFREITPGMFPYSTLFLVQQRIHARHQSTRPFWKNYAFYVKGGLSDSEVDPRPSDCKLWSLRSCGPSLSSTSLSWRTGRFPWSLSFSSCSTLTRWSTSVVQVSLHARCVQRQMPMVDDLLQFIDLGGRRCDAAATSSSCRPQ